MSSSDTSEQYEAPAGVHHGADNTAAALTVVQTVDRVQLAGGSSSIHPLVDALPDHQNHE
jgi:hypothetical protein